MSAITIPAAVPERVESPGRLLRILPSFTDCAFAFPIAALFLLLGGVRGILGDSDTGWQIRTGDWILRHGHVPIADPFSFTKPGQNWFAWEWLWDVLFSLVHRNFGLSGVALVNTLLLSAVSVLLFRLVRRHARNDARALIITLAAMCATAFHWLARPHLLSWVLILIALHIVDRAESGRTRLLWWMPALTAFWANLHGSFPIGIFLLLAYGGMHVLQEVAYSGFDAGKSALALRRTYFLAAAVSIGASLLNPYGWHLHEHIIRYLADTKQLNSISEYTSFDFHSPLALCVEGFLILGGCAALRSFRAHQWAQGIVLLAWAHLAFKSARNVPIFVFMAAPAIAAMLTAALEGLEHARVAAWLRKLGAEILDFGKEFDAFERVERIPFVPVAVTVVLAALLGLLPVGGKPVADFDSRDFPVSAAQVVKQNPAAHVFTFDQWGGYMIYRLYPEMKVFVDGRSDFYGADYSKDWVNALRARYDWQREFTRFSIDTVLIKTTDPLAEVLKNRREWKPVFDDGLAIIFRKQ